MKYLVARCDSMFVKLLQCIVVAFMTCSNIFSQTFLHSESCNSGTAALLLENTQFVGISAIPLKNLNISYYNSLYQASFQYQDFTVAANYTFFKNNFFKSSASVQTFGNFGDGFKELYGGIQTEISPFKELDIAAELYATHDDGFKTYYQIGAKGNIYNELSLFAAYGTPFFGFKNGSVLKTGIIIQTEKLALKMNFEWQQDERMLFKRIMTGACYTVF